jgi:hypothetical protein
MWWLHYDSEREPKGMDQAPRSDWLPINKVFARIEKIVGVGALELAIYEIKSALSAGKAKALERAVAVKGGSHKERELPPSFWQAATLSCIHDASGPRVTVRHRGRESGFNYHYFVWQPDVEKLWPANKKRIDAAASAERPLKGKSSAGRKPKYDWDSIWLEAAAYMYVNAVPKSLTELCEKIGNRFPKDKIPEDTGNTSMEDYLRPLYLKFKQLDGK